MCLYEQMLALFHLPVKLQALGLICVGQLHSGSRNLGPDDLPFSRLSRSSQCCRSPEFIGVSSCAI